MPNLGLFYPFVNASILTPSDLNSSRPQFPLPPVSRRLPPPWILPPSFPFTSFFFLFRPSRFYDGVASDRYPSPRSIGLFYRFPAPRFLFSCREASETLSDFSECRPKIFCSLFSPPLTAFRLLLGNFPVSFFLTSILLPRHGFNPGL